MPESTEAGLIAAARGGDVQALEALVLRHQDRVCRFGMKMCRDPEDAQEILQETMLSLARGLGGFREDASLATWLYAVARSHCIKQHRRSKFAPSELESLETPNVPMPPADARFDPEVATAAREVDEALQFAIAGLDETSREVLVLRDIEGLTALEVAGVLGPTTSAVKSRLHRARLAIRDALAPLLDPELVMTTAGESCPDVLMQFSRHLEGEIDAATCSELEAHLERCPRCRGACDSLRRSLALCGTAGEAVQVPTAVQASVKVALRDFLAET